MTTPALCGCSVLLKTGFFFGAAAEAEVRSMDFRPAASFSAARALDAAVGSRVRVRRSLRRCGWVC